MTGGADLSLSTEADGVETTLDPRLDGIGEIRQELSNEGRQKAQVEGRLKCRGKNGLVLKARELAGVRLVETGWGAQRTQINQRYARAQRVR